MVEGVVEKMQGLRSGSMLCVNFSAAALLASNFIGEVQALSERSDDRAFSKGGNVSSQQTPDRARPRLWDILPLNTSIATTCIKFRADY